MHRHIALVLICCFLAACSTRSEVQPLPPEQTERLERSTDRAIDAFYRIAIANPDITEDRWISIGAILWRGEDESIVFKYIGSNTPAHDAGIMTGDVVSFIGVSQGYKTPAEAAREVGRYLKRDGEVRFKLVRGEETIDTTIKGLEIPNIRFVVRPDWSLYTRADGKTVRLSDRLVSMITDDQLAILMCRGYALVEAGYTSSDVLDAATHKTIDIKALAMAKKAGYDIDGATEFLCDLSKQQQDVIQYCPVGIK